MFDAFLGGFLRERIEADLLNNDIRNVSFSGHAVLIYFCEYLAFARVIRADENSYWSCMNRFW